MLDRGREGARRNREIKQRMLRIAERLPDLREEVELAVVARDVLQERRQPREGRLIDGAPRRDAVPDALDELLAVHRQSSNAHNRYVQLPACRERLKRRKNLLVGEVAGDTEDNKGVRLHSASPSGGARAPFRHYNLSASARRWRERGVNVIWNLWNLESKIWNLKAES